MYYVYYLLGIENFTVSLAAYPTEEAFKLTRFVPMKNNVRSTWLLNKADNGMWFLLLFI